ncbi:MAG: hypothetical protein ACOYXR_12495 [Nitrospirota bacterium]
MIPGMYIEVEDGPNGPGCDPMRFRELDPPWVVTRVRLFDRRDDGEWCLVTGVRKGDAPWEPARVRKVEDSGVGVAYLIYGGLWGIRLCPADMGKPWRFDDRDQWGAPYLLLTDATDIVMTPPVT